MRKHSLRNFGSTCSLRWVFLVASQQVRGPLHMCLLLEVTGWWEARGLLLGFACTAVFHCKHRFVTVNESILIWVLYFQIWNSFSDCVCFILNKQQHSLIYKVIHYYTKYFCYFFIILEKTISCFIFTMWFSVFLIPFAMSVSKL